MAFQAILARRQIRLAALAALQTLGITVDSPGDWNTPSGDLPAIMVRTPGDRKEPMAKSAPDFTTTVTLEIEAKVQEQSASDAQDSIENWGALIEQALFTDYTLNGLIQSWASIDTHTGISSEGREHIGALKMTVSLELVEGFDPFASVTAPGLTNVQLHVDSIGTFDPNGTYANPPFPASVIPAPRTSGPDGRDEGALNINLPQ